MDTILQNRIWTDDELLALPDDGNKHELMKGVLKMSPTGIEHEYLGVRLTSALDNFLRVHKLGIVVGSSAGFWMKNRDFLSPDVSFKAKHHSPQQDQILRQSDVISGENVVSGFTPPVSDLFAELEF